MQLTPLTRHASHVIPITSNTPNRHTRTKIRVADACRDQGSPIATRIPPNTGFAKTSHSHKTWMTEDGIPEILAEQRLGHQVPGMRGLYAHTSQQMRDELTAALQARWEESLRQRAAIDPHSPVPLLDNLLAPFRAVPPGDDGSASPRLTLAEVAGPAREDTISQIPPNTAKAPIRSVG